MKRLIITSTILVANAAFSQQISDLNWVVDSGSGDIANVATIKLQNGYAYLGVAGTDDFLKINGNPPNGRSYTIAPTDLRWFGILQFAEVGYIKDDEKLDPNEILAQLRKNTEAGNEYRKKQGYSALTLIGWASPPEYDKNTKRLEWGTRLRDEQGNETVNMTTKILGRSGYTKVILVTNPNTYTNDWREFKKYLNNFEYLPGSKYSEWKQGDKIAAYGLGALILGGAAAVATSKGGLKAIGVAIIAGLAAVWAGIKKLFGKK